MPTIYPLKKFADSRGWSLNDIYQVAKTDKFQINYSILYPNIVKAWHRHANQDDYFCVLNGMAQVGVFDLDIEKSYKYFIGEHNPAVVHIKAGEWHGLTALGNQPCGLLYLVTNLYDPKNPDEERRAFDSFCGESFWKPENK